MRLRLRCDSTRCLLGERGAGRGGGGAKRGGGREARGRRARGWSRSAVVSLFSSWNQAAALPSTESSSARTADASSWSLGSRGARRLAPESSWETMMRVSCRCPSEKQQGRGGGRIVRRRFSFLSRAGSLSEKAQLLLHFSKENTFPFQTPSPTSRLISTATPRVTTFRASTCLPFSPRGKPLVSHSNPALKRGERRGSESGSWLDQILCLTVSSFWPFWPFAPLFRSIATPLSWSPSRPFHSSLPLSLRSRARIIGARERRTHHYPLFAPKKHKTAQ